MLNKQSLLLPLLFVIITFSCSNDKNNSPVEETTIVANIKGVVQKGPFTSGSSITIQELGDSFSPNGTIYETVTNDDFGTYSLNSSINSNYIEVITRGFYFNEVSGNLSSANLTLRSLVKVNEEIASNINILTTLSRDRIIYLVNEEGLTFDNAQIKAKEEVLTIFKITNTNSISDFAKMDLSKNTESDAILIAISSILQGENSVAELSELISKIILDIKTDGTLDSLETINKLKENSKKLNLFKIRENLENRYNSLGLNISIPLFEKYATRLFPLAILSTIPEINELEVTDSYISIKFNKPINPNTISEKSLSVKTENNVIEGGYEYIENNFYKIIFKPTIDFESSKNISISINSNLKGIDLTSLGSEYTFNFTTGSNDIVSDLSNYYTFSNNIEDQSGNNRHATTNSAATYSNDISGNSNSALFFKGDRTSIDIPRSFNPINTEWTYSIWFKLDRLPSQSTNGNDVADFYLLTRRDFDYVSDCYLRIDDGDDIIRTTIDHGNYKVTSNVKVNPNTWYHVVMSNSSETISIYINGELKVTSDLRFKSNFSNNEPFRINWSYGQVDNISGSIDNVRLYERSLNSNEVNELYTEEKN
ncbi:LamG-like jellyroll fold domain-containing protein [Tenacibaculum ovolyticum]|uniref:LamG-like jellyroll fold domain-containing protein n=1 Tax=Tenacibaculum ovolyticum TaxID=104270 RepID=UPI001F21E93E|nr:LamG-like jellyroll fold domain-containing protein [Tenacibaculum ovolyticum]